MENYLYHATTVNRQSASQKHHYLIVLSCEKNMAEDNELSAIVDKWLSQARIQDFRREGVDTQVCFDYYRTSKIQLLFI